MSLSFYQHLYTETLFLLPQEREGQPLPAPPEEKPGREEAISAPGTLPEPAEAPAPFAVVGANRKGLVMLVQLPEAAFRALPDLEFLQKLLNAIHHGPEDVAFVNARGKEPVSLAALQETLPVRNLISFGCSVQQETAGSSLTPPYSPASAQGIKLLLADELAVIVNAQEKKVQLWNALKQMFLS